MDDIRAFERQVAGVVQDVVGPTRPVDAMAVARLAVDAQSTRWRFRSMFSATKFVVAGVGIALFGGLLFSGLQAPRSDDQRPGVGASPSAPTAMQTLTAVTLEQRTPSPISDKDIIVAQDGSGDHTTIQRAIAAADRGETIRVRPGRYEEQLYIDKNISVVGDGPRDEIVVVPTGVLQEPDANQPNGAINVRGASAQIVGLTIRDERERDRCCGPVVGEVVVDGSAEPVLEGLAVEHIRVGDRSRAVVRGNDVDMITVEAISSPTIEANRVSHITVGDPSDDEDGRGRVQSAVVIDNDVSDSLSIGGSGTLVEANRIASLIDEGIGTLITENDLGQVDLNGIDSVVHDNRIGGDYGIFVGGTGSDITIEDNDVAGRWLGIGTAGSGHVTIRGNTVRGSDVGLLVASQDADITGNDLCDNGDDIVRTWEAQVDGAANSLCNPDIRIAGSFDSTAVQGDFETDADGFVLEELAPGIQRLVHDGAGHMVRADWLFGSLFVEGIDVDDDGSVRVWIRPASEEGASELAWRIDHASRAGDGMRQWILGQPGEIIAPWEQTNDPQQAGGALWAAGARALDRNGRGARRIVEPIAVRDDGMLWARVATRDGRRMARFDGKRWKVFDRQPGPGAGQIQNGIIDAHGNLWSDRGDRGGLSVYDGRSVRTVGEGYTMYPYAFDDHGRLWGTFSDREHREPDVVVVDAALVERIGTGQSAGDAELASRFPKRLAGQDIDVTTLDGGQWLLQFSPRPRQADDPGDAVEAYLEVADATLQDLTVGYTSFEPSPGNRAYVAAVRVRGSRAAALDDAVIPLMLGDFVEPAVEVVEIAGKSVGRVTDSSMPGRYPQYTYTMGDTVWVIDAAEPVLSEIVRALP